MLCEYSPFIAANFSNASSTSFLRCIEEWLSFSIDSFMPSEKSVFNSGISFSKKSFKVSEIMPSFTAHDKESSTSPAILLILLMASLKVLSSAVTFKSPSKPVTCL